MLYEQASTRAGDLGLAGRAPGTPSRGHCVRTTVTSPRPMDRCAPARTPAPGSNYRPGYRSAHAPGYRWLCARVVSWGDPRTSRGSPKKYVDRLLTLKRNGEALDVVALGWPTMPTFAQIRRRHTATCPSGRRRRRQQARRASPARRFFDAFCRRPLCARRRCAGATAGRVTHQSRAGGPASMPCLGA